MALRPQILSQVGEQKENQSENSQRGTDPKIVERAKAKRARKLPDNSDGQETEQATESSINLFSPMRGETKTKN